MLPAAQILAKSFLTKSTIIKFSARSFSDFFSANLFFKSSSLLRPRGAVPFIGREIIFEFLMLKNNSGLEEMIKFSSSFKNAE